jgi:hypothetical protein
VLAKVAGLAEVFPEIGGYALPEEETVSAENPAEDAIIGLSAMELRDVRRRW